MKYKVAILKNESVSDHEYWVEACKANASISHYDVIDLTSDNWIKKLFSVEYDLILLRPPGKTEAFKRLYDERVYLLNGKVSEKIYPGLDEILIYENKRFLRDWLTINDVPHPATWVFYDRTEADKFLSERKAFPVVAKLNIGASGSGVRILKNGEEAASYLNKAFTEGIKPQTGPKVTKGSLLKKIKKVFRNKGFLTQRLKDYTQTGSLVQKGYVIFQEFIPHDYEWRCVKIGDSFFAHKKIAVDNKSSGTLVKGYDDVPSRLLDFIRDLSERTGLSSVAIDVFEKEDQYLVNEIQCFFGQSDPYQMLVDGKPGRYVFKENSWHFEEGMFNTNQSYDLRLEHAISLTENRAL